MANHSLRGWLLGGAATAGAVGAALTYLVMHPDSQLLGRTIVAGDDPAEIALTFDDGPNEVSTLPLLELLARFGVRATFFMIGRFVRQRPDIVRQVQAAGHLIGNHTMTHPFLATKTGSVITAEIRDCNALLEDTLGAPIRYFRAPHGARRPAVLRFARELGLETVQWNVQGNDWEPIGVPGILRHIEPGLQRARRERRGANILLHDGFDRRIDADRSDTVRATELLLLQARQQSQRLVTVDHWG